MGWHRLVTAAAAAVADDQAAGYCEPAVIDIVVIPAYTFSRGLLDWQLIRLL